MDRSHLPPFSRDAPTTLPAPPESIPSPPTTQSDTHTTQEGWTPRGMLPDNFGSPFASEPPLRPPEHRPPTIDDAPLHVGDANSPYSPRATTSVSKSSLPNTLPDAPLSIGDYNSPYSPRAVETAHQERQEYLDLYSNHATTNDSLSIGDPMSPYSPRAVDMAHNERQEYLDLYRTHAPTNDSIRMGDYASPYSPRQNVRREPTGPAARERRLDIGDTNSPYSPRSVSDQQRRDRQLHQRFAERTIALGKPRAVPLNPETSHSAPATFATGKHSMGTSPYTTSDQQRRDEQLNKGFPEQTMELGAARTAASAAAGQPSGDNRRFYQSQEESPNGVPSRDAGRWETSTRTPNENVSKTGNNKRYYQDTSGDQLLRKQPPRQLHRPKVTRH